MAFFNPQAADESFTHMHGRRGSFACPRTATSAHRSPLLRWVWVVRQRETETGQQTCSSAYVTDDFGDLVPVRYIQASVAGSKDPT